MNKIGTRIKILRRDANLTQAELSSDILTRTSLSKIENGTLEPSLSQLEHIASKLNTTISYILQENTYASSTLSKQNESNLSKLYIEKKYFKIIETIKPINFLTFYYVGMSYYNLDLKVDAIKYLSSCEELFNSQDEYSKNLTVEKLAIALNSLRKITISNYSDQNNLLFLKKALYYLDLYNINKCEIYYIVNNNISNYYLFTNQYEKTISFIQDFLHNNTSVNSLKVLPFIHLNLSNAYFAIKEYDLSIGSIKNSIFFYNYIGKNYDAGECYLNLFNCYLYKGDFYECELLLRNLFENYNDIKLLNIFMVLELTYLYNIGESNLILEKYSKINIAALRRKTRSDFNFILGRTYFLIGKFNSSKRYYLKCISYLKESNKYLDLYILYKDLYHIDNNESDKKSYIEYLNLYKNTPYNSLHPSITSPHYI